MLDLLTLPDHSARCCLPEPVSTEPRVGLLRRREEEQVTRFALTPVEDPKIERIRPDFHPERLDPMPSRRRARRHYHPRGGRSAPHPLLRRSVASSRRIPRTLPRANDRRHRAHSAARDRTARTRASAPPAWSRSGLRTSARLGWAPEPAPNRPAAALDASLAWPIDLRIRARAHGCNRSRRNYARGRECPG